MSLRGVLQSFNRYSNDQLSSMSNHDKRWNILDNLKLYTAPADPIFQEKMIDHIPEDALIGKAAVVIYLLKTGFQTPEQLLTGTTDDHRNYLIVHVNQRTDLPIPKLQSLNDIQLVQLALLWYADIGSTMAEVLSHFGNPTRDQQAQLAQQPEQLAKAVVDKICAYSNQPAGDFTGYSHEALAGKLAIIVFWLKDGKSRNDLQKQSTSEQRQALALETYYRTGIPYQFFDSHVTEGWNYQFIDTFSDIELVKMSLAWYVIDKPYASYNQVTSAMTHDAHTGDEKQGATTDISKDQDRTVTEQLQSGIRTLRISAESDGTLAHSGMPFGPLSGLLKMVTDFLDSNPYEVVTIVDESSWPSTPDTPSTLQTIYESNTESYLFRYKQNGMAPFSTLVAGVWPTIKDMVAAGKRLVVLSSIDYDHSVPWRLHSYDGTKRDECLISMDRDDYSWDTASVLRPPMTVVKSSNSFRYQPSNHLYLLNHYFYFVLGAINTSDKSFCQWGNGELIVEYATMAWYKTNRKPNFLMVDYYDQADDSGDVVRSKHFLFNLVIALNHPAGSAPFLTVREVMRQKTIPVTLTNQLFIGKVYTITCKAQTDSGQSCCLTRGSNNTVTMQPACTPADPGYINQQWKLVYNGSDTGLALVSPDETLALYDPNNTPAEPESSTELITAGYTLGNIGSGFAILTTIDDPASYRIAKSNMQTNDPVNQQWSVLDVKGRNNTISPGDTLVRWSLNRGENQHWIFNEVAVNPFIPPLPSNPHFLFMWGPQQVTVISNEEIPEFPFCYQTTETPFYFPGTGRVILSLKPDGSVAYPTDANSIYISATCEDSDSRTTESGAPKDGGDITYLFSAEGKYTFFLSVSPQNPVVGTATCPACFMVWLPD